MNVLWHEIPGGDQTDKELCETLRAELDPLRGRIQCVALFIQERDCADFYDVVTEAGMRVIPGIKCRDTILNEPAKDFSDAVIDEIALLSAACRSPIVALDCESAMAKVYRGDKTLDPDRISRVTLPGIKTVVHTGTPWVHGDDDKTVDRLLLAHFLMLHVNNGLLLDLTLSGRDCPDDKHAGEARDFFDNTRGRNRPTMVYPWTAEQTGGGKAAVNGWDAASIRRMFETEFNYDKWFFPGWPLARQMADKVWPTPRSSKA